MRFEKISEEQFIKDSICDDFSEENKEQAAEYFKRVYNELKLPKRATMYSAGYDFFAPRGFTLEPHETIKIPTGIRVLLDNDKFLAVYPRSGLGFKYKLQLNNTVGIIDADYSNSDNEGHIFIKMTNEGEKILNVNKGEAFAQGIIQQYFLVEEDSTSAERNGGFGSTT